MLSRMPISPRNLVADEGEQRVRLHGVSWEFYERLLEARGDDAGLRVAYLEGEVPKLDPALLTRFMLSGGSQTEAVRSLRRALRAARKKRTR